MTSSNPMSSITIIFRRGNKVFPTPHRVHICKLTDCYKENSLQPRWAMLTRTPMDFSDYGGMQVCFENYVSTTRNLEFGNSFLHPTQTAKRQGPRIKCVSLYPKVYFFLLLFSFFLPVSYLFRKLVSMYFSSLCLPLSLPLDLLTILCTHKLR